MGSYVGIDLHRRRSVIVVLNDDGDRVSWSRIENTPANLASTPKPPSCSSAITSNKPFGRWGEVFGDATSPPP